MAGDGRGTPDHLGVAKDIDIYTSSLSKGLGSFGGYVASQNNVIDYCINRSKSFIYTSALPSFLVEYTQAKIESKDRARQRRKLKKNTTKITKGLTEIGYEILSNTQIIPIILKGREKSDGFWGFSAGRRGICSTYTISYGSKEPGKAENISYCMVK